MSITSFYFLCFYAVLLLLYYVLPHKMQWGLLLAASVIFYILSGNPVMIVYPLVSTAVTYIFVCMMYKKDGISASASKRKTALILSILFLYRCFLLSCFSDFPVDF